MSQLPLRSVRLNARSASTLQSFVGTAGEIFYDSTNQTLRVYPGNIAAGKILADRDWVTGQLPSIAGLATQTYVNQAVAAIPEYLLKITADDSTVLAVDRDETLQVRGVYGITTSISTDSTGIQLVINGSELATREEVNIAVQELATEEYVNAVFSNFSEDLCFGGFTYPLTASSLQFQTGVSINEISSDPTFTDNSPSAVPTESAIRGYIDRRLGNDQDGQVVNPVNKIGPTYVITTGQQTIDLSTGQSTSDGNATFNADGVMLASWIASFTTTRSLNIINLTAGRFMKIYVRNTNVSSRIVQINASATAEGLAPVNLAAGAGAVSVSQITLAPTSGSAVITVWNTGSGTIVGMVN